MYVLLFERSKLNRLRHKHIYEYLRSTVSVAEAVGEVGRPFVGMHLYFPESPGIKADMSRVPSTMTFTRDFRDLTKHPMTK